MITHDLWLGFGINRKAVVFSDTKECTIGGYLTNLDYSDTDIYSADNLELSFFDNWLDIGLSKGWISKMGCVKHEIDESNFVLDLQGMISLHPEKLPPRTHIPENKQYFAYQRTKEEDAKLLFSKATETVPCDSIIDIGAGIGELLQFAKDFGYTDVSGVEVQPELVSKALPGLSEVISIESAETFLLPDKQMHVFMFNPFNNIIMEKFLKNNIDNIKNNKSLVLLNYNFNAHHLMLHYGMTQYFNNGYSSLYKFD